MLELNFRKRKKKLESCAITKPKCFALNIKKLNEEKFLLQCANGDYPSKRSDILAHIYLKGQSEGLQILSNQVH